MSKVEITAPYRIIVRGTINGRRVRRVRTVQTTEAGAIEASEQISQELVTKHKLTDPFVQVYPPSGLRLDGTVSKGHTTDADGFVVKEKATVAA